jgi:hypothetical protein
LHRSNGRASSGSRPCRTSLTATSEFAHGWQRTSSAAPHGSPACAAQAAHQRDQRES